MIWPFKLKKRKMHRPTDTAVVLRELDKIYEELGLLKSSVQGKAENELRTEHLSRIYSLKVRLLSDGRVPNDTKDKVLQANQFIEVLKLARSPAAAKVEETSAAD